MDLAFPTSGLRSGPVLLRPWRTDDLPARLELDRDPEIYRWMPIPRDASAAAATEALRRAVDEAATGSPTSAAVADAGDPDLVLGAVDWRNGFPTPPFSVVDVGYCVLPAARGRGVAGTALGLLAGWLLASDGADVHRVQLDHAVANVGSCRTAQRAGFVVEGERAAFLPLREHAGAELVRHAVCMHGRVRS